MKMSSWILAAALTTAATAALACGVCIDDKVAAVYDHAQVQRALKAGQVVVYCELTGPREPRALGQQAGQAARGLRGVDPSSVRTADELPVVSFVLDPATQSPAAAVDRLRQRLQPTGVTPTMLKVMEAQPTRKKS